MDEKELPSQTPPPEFDEYGFLISTDGLDAIESRCHIYRY